MNGAHPSRPEPAHGRSSGTGQRLRTYLIGVGIGVILLGMFWMMRRQAAMSQHDMPDPQGRFAPAPNAPPAVK
jgi:hypothetical protein